MMQNLMIREGGYVELHSKFKVRNPIAQQSTPVTSMQVPAGQYCKLQPHSTGFIEIAAAVGPRVRPPQPSNW